jgi:NADH dehydrogenase
VILVEAGPRVLASFAEELSAYAQKALESSASRSTSASR